METTAEQSRAYADRGAVWSTVTLEKVVLLGLLSVIFAETLPGVDVTTLQLFFGVAAVVVVNAAFTLALARRARSLESIAITVVARTVANVVLVVAVGGCSRHRGRPHRRHRHAVLPDHDQPAHHPPRPLAAGGGQPG